MAVEVTKWKLLALAIAIGEALCIVLPAHELRDAVCALVVVLPLALIWFPEVLGGFTGSLGLSGYVTEETPPVLVSAAGWFLLVGFPIIVWYVSRDATAS